MYILNAFVHSIFVITPRYPRRTLSRGSLLSSRASSPSSGMVSPSSSQPSPNPEKMTSSSPVPLPVIPVKANGIKVKQEIETSCQMEDAETRAMSPVNGDHNGDKDDTETLGDKRKDGPVAVSPGDSQSPPPLVAKSSLGGQDKPETKSDSPLAALQMLCDTQKKTPKTPKISESSTSDSGSMLAFSWACNQAQVPRSTTESEATAMA